MNNDGYIEILSTPMIMLMIIQYFHYNCKIDAVCLSYFAHSLQVEKFRITGNFVAQAPGEYDRLLKDFFRSHDVTATLNISGVPETPILLSVEQLNLSVMSMEFFDRLLDDGKKKCSLL